MPAVNLSPIFNAQVNFDGNGTPLSQGLIYGYAAGSTSPQAMYLDPSGVFPSPNPITLGSDGRTPGQIWLQQGLAYKLVLTDSTGVVYGSYDNISGAVTSVPAVQTLPSGIIVAWSGQIGSIPTGWVLCDGSTPGVPDLRDKFIIGAGGNYPVNTTGGTADAVVVNHTHVATNNVSFNDPGHTHMSNNNGAYNGGGAGAAMGVSGNTPGYATTLNTTGITLGVTTTIAAAGQSGTNQNLPPYYALAYIAKT